jgi:glutamyl-tRNA synthetase
MTRSSRKTKAIEWFGLDGLNKAPARLDFAKLDSVNKHYMASPTTSGCLACCARPGDAGKLSGRRDVPRILNAMPALKIARRQHGPVLRTGAIPHRHPPHRPGPARPIRSTMSAGTPCGPACRGWRALSAWTEPAIKAELTHYCDQNGISMGKIGPVLRAVLTGGAPAPDIALVLALLGRNEAFARVRDYARTGG